MMPSTSAFPHSSTISGTVGGGVAMMARSIFCGTSRMVGKDSRPRIVFRLRVDGKDLSVFGPEEVFEDGPSDGPLFLCGADQGNRFRIEHLFNIAHVSRRIFLRAWSFGMNQPQNRRPKRTASFYRHCIVTFLFRQLNFTLLISSLILTIPSCSSIF